jgi:hypothetical protein
MSCTSPTIFRTQPIQKEVKILVREAVLVEQPGMEMMCQCLPSRNGRETTPNEPGSSSSGPGGGSGEWDDDGVTWVALKPTLSDPCLVPPHLATAPAPSPLPSACELQPKGRSAAAVAVAATNQQHSGSQRADSIHVQVGGMGGGGHGASDNTSNNNMQGSTDASRAVVAESRDGSSGGTRVSEPGVTVVLHMRTPPHPEVGVVGRGGEVEMRPV